MLTRLLIAVQVGALVCAGVARGDGGKTYSGTFKEAEGRAGPLQCELVAKGEGKWAANFSGKNTGSGPNKPYQCSGELVGKEENGKVNLTGEIMVQRQGMYTVAAVLADNGLKATFAKKAGGGAGTFELVAGKTDAPATTGKTEAPPAEKKDEPKPAPVAAP